MKRSLFIVAVITILGAASFAQNERIGTRQWKLVQLSGERVADSSTAYLELSAEQTRFTGNTGCNSMFGGVEVRGQRIRFANVGMTRRACLDPRRQRIESAIVHGLGLVDRFRRVGNTLQLYDRRRLVMTFVASTRQPPQPNDGVRLEDSKWTLDAIEGIPVARIGRTAFVVFDREKGSAGGNSSCNVFGGSYTATGDRLRITEVVSTMRACIEDERMTIERRFLDGLRDANRYEISGGKLLLFQNRRLLLTLNGERK